MVEIKFVPIADIVVLKDRFRELFTEKNLTGLQDSIATGLGLSNAITLRKDLSLITGESRLKAIGILHEVGMPAYYHGEAIPEGTIPAIVMETTHKELEYLEAELHENTQREDFTYIEEAQAIARIATIKQAILDSEKLPKEERLDQINAGFAPLGIPLKKVSKEAIKQTTAQLFEGEVNSYRSKQVKDSLLIVDALEENSDLAKKLLKATSMTDGQKILKRHAQEEQRSSLALAQGKTFSNATHSVIHGCCLEEMLDLPTKSFDVCLTDPIYGINAGNFANGAGKYNNFDHGYDDSLETFLEIMPKAIKLVSRLLKDSAHLYLACDIRNYPALVQMVKESSTPSNPWKVTNAPFIQYKTAGGRVPHPGFTPRRSYELWLYAYRGDKQEYKMINDVIPCEADPDNSSGHGAGKPKELLKTFLNRSCMPGDTVLDFMAGSGSMLPACHELKLKCTAIELGQVYYGECLQRLKELR